MKNDLDRMILAYLDRRMSQAEFDEFQSHLATDADARRRYCELAALEDELRTQSVSDIKAALDPTLEHAGDRQLAKPFVTGKAIAFAVVLSVVLLGLATLSLLGDHRESSLAEVTHTVEDLHPVSEMTMSGHAMLSHIDAVRWPDERSHYQVGDTLPEGLFQIEEGAAKLDFFCGATLIATGPTRLLLESDYRVAVISGNCRVQVPDVARGFVVHVADSEIIDLGTEFSVNVDAHSASLSVMDGEVIVRDVQKKERHVRTGEQIVLSGSVESNADQSDPSVQETPINDRFRTSSQARYTKWLEWSRAIVSDPELVAYFPIARNAMTTSPIRQSSSRAAASDGVLVGLPARSESRFLQHGSGLNFRRPGSRLRVRIEGEFPAVSFACWVRIDALPHRFNALVMTDGYDPGEPHWQITHDGRMMLSIMAGDESDVPDPASHTPRVVRDEPWHRVYYSPAIWQPQDSGRWKLLASVYDPASRKVCHYVDGKLVIQHRIQPQHLAETIRFGNTEIGNWGQPYRPTPVFAVRNLHGSIDELMVFSKPLSPVEIKALYQTTRP